MTVKGKHAYYLRMDKKHAIQMFGSQTRLAKALEITPQAISQWPEILPRRLEDQVIGAAVRLGIQVDVGKLARTREEAA